MMAYNIPTVARELKTNARLRACIEKGMHAGLRLPADLDYHDVTCANIPDDYLHSLWLLIVAKSGGAASEPSRLAQLTARLSTRLLMRLDTAAPTKIPDTEKSSDIGMGDQICAGDSAVNVALATAPPASRLAGLHRLLESLAPLASSKLSREGEVGQLLAYSEQHLRCAPVTWHAAEGDSRLVGATEAIGSLYKEFYADRCASGSGRA